MSSQPRPRVQPSAGRARVVVRPMRPQDTRRSGRLHKHLLPHGFFARLGPSFLATYHRAHVLSPHAVALVAEVDGVVEGFLIGVVRPQAHGRAALRQSGVRLAAAGGLALLLRPALLVLFLRTRVLRYVRAIWRRLNPAGVGVMPAAKPVSVLQHVGVAEPARRLGVGRQLVAAFEDHVRQAGVGQVVLLTTPEEDGAPAFYRRLGYQDEGAVRGADGHEWLRYRRST